MVIRNNNSYIIVFGQGHGLVTRHTAIHGQQNPYFSWDGDIRYVRCFQAISFGDAVRNIAGDLGTDFFQKLIQQGCGRHTIHIIVSENKNFIPVQEGLSESCNSFGHSCQTKRGAKVVQGWMQKCLNVFFGFQTPLNQ